MIDDRHASPGISVIDEERQALLRGLGPDDGWGILPLVVKIFLDESPAIMSGLRRAVETGNASGARESAHQLRGAAANLGAVRVAELCHRLELAAAVGTPLRPDLLQQLESALDEASTLLSEIVTGAQAP